MSETIRLDYDPQKASAGLQKLQKELDKTAQSGSKLGDSVAKSAAKIDKLAPSTNNAEQAAKQAQNTFGGMGDALEAMGVQGIGGALGQTEKFVRGLNDLGGVTGAVGAQLLSIVPHITLVVGALGAAKVAWDSFATSQQKSIEQSESTTKMLADMTAAILDYTNAVPGLVDKLTILSEKEKRDDEITRQQTETYKALSKRMAEVQIAAQKLATTLQESRDSIDFSDFVSSLDDMEKIQGLINDKITHANEIMLDQKTTLEDIQKIQKEIGVLEARRVQLQDELLQGALNRLTKEQNAEEAKLKTMLDSEEKVEERRKANHAAELARIAAEKAARDKSNEDREKAEEDAAKRRDQELRDKVAALQGEKKAILEVGQAQQQVSQQAAGGGGPGGIHGEGVAMGGNAPGPFARGFAREQQGGFFALPWQQAGVNNAAFAGIPGLGGGQAGPAVVGGGGGEIPQEDRLDKFVKQARDHAVNNRQSRREIINRAIEKDPNLSRRDAARQLEGEEPQSKELQDAIKEATQKDIELAGKKAGISKDTIDVMKKKADILAEQEQEIAEIQQRLDEIGKLDDALLKGAQRRRAQRAARGN